MILQFDETIFYWRGPAPWFFVTMPPEESAELKAIASRVTYGWGCIPVQAQIGNTEWETSLIPKEGRYLVPIKASIRKAEQLEEGDIVTVTLDIEE
jgi:hypothetical protein